MGSPGYNGINNFLEVTRAQGQGAVCAGACLPTRLWFQSHLISFQQAEAHILVRNNIISSLELRSAHRRAIAKAEMSRWRTGTFASLKPELAFLTHESCLQQLVWDLPSHWKSLDKRFLIPPLHVHFPDWVLKSPHLHCCFPSPEQDPPWAPGNLSGDMARQKQH